MEMVAVSVFDKASAAFGRPVFVGTVAQAVRGFTDEVNGGDGDVSRHPQDFALYRVGAFDDSSGLFTSVSPPERVVEASDLKRSGVASMAGAST